MAVRSKRREGKCDNQREDLFFLNVTTTASTTTTTTTTTTTKIICLLRTYINVSNALII